MKAVLNGLVSGWVRKDHTFNAVANNFIANEQVLWVSWFQQQTRCWFQNIKSSAKARAEDIGLGQQSDTRNKLLLDKDARICNVTDVC